MATKKKKPASSNKKKSSKKTVKKKVIKKKVIAKKKQTKIVKSVPPKKAAPVSSQPVLKAYRPSPNEKKLGEVGDYFSNIGVIALTLQDSLSLGDTIHVHGHTTDMTQKVDSMQIEHGAVQTAKKGDSVGIKVIDKCRKGDSVYRVN